MPLAEIHVTLKPSLFDAQGATILKALHQLGHSSVQNARIGKYITLEIEGADPAALQGQLDLMCQQLLANPVIENYEITLPGTAVPVAIATSGSGAEGEAVPVLTTRSSGPASSGSMGVEPLSSAGGMNIADAFTVNFRTYEAMTTEAKLALRALALQKHGSWINREIRNLKAAWILCVGQSVVESGDTLDTYPTENHLRQLGNSRDLVPWVFTRPPA